MTLNHDTFQNVLDFCNVKTRLTVLSTATTFRQQHEAVCKATCESLDIDGPKAKARKYKTWASVLARHSDKLCRKCGGGFIVDSYGFYNSIQCFECFEYQQSQANDEVQQLRIDQVERITQTAAMREFHLTKTDLDAIRRTDMIVTQWRIQGRYQDVYLFNQDAVIRLCLQKYGSAEGLVNYLESQEKKREQRLINKQLRLEKNTQTYATIVEMIHAQFDPQEAIVPSIQQVQHHCLRYRDLFLSLKLSQKKLKSIVARTIVALQHSLHNEAIEAVENTPCNVRALVYKWIEHDHLPPRMDDAYLTTLLTSTARDHTKNMRLLFSIMESEPALNGLAAVNKEFQSRIHVFDSLQDTLSIPPHKVRNQYLHFDIDLHDIVQMEIRKHGLTKMGKQYNFTVRDDSILCNNYIYTILDLNEHPYYRETRFEFSDVVEKMEEIAWYYSNTSYQYTYDEYYRERKFKYYMNTIDRSNLIKKVALKEWLREEMNNVPRQTVVKKINDINGINGVMVPVRVKHAVMKLY